jgi:hypothetical protein
MVYSSGEFNRRKLRNINPFQKPGLTLDPRPMRKLLQSREDLRGILTPVHEHELPVQRRHCKCVGW